MPTRDSPPPLPGAVRLWPISNSLRPQPRAGLRKSALRFGSGRRQTQAADASAATSASAIGALTPASYNSAWPWAGAICGSATSPSPRSATQRWAGARARPSGSVFAQRLPPRRVGADRADGRALTALRKSDNYSVDVGGAYSITRNIALTGGVRYRIDRDRASALKDDRRDSQAVYVGTAFKF